MMTLYTVEVTTDAVTDGNWASLEAVLDVIPGTLLLRDVERPALLFPVEAESPSNAAAIVNETVCQAGLTVIAQGINETCR